MTGIIISENDDNCGPPLSKVALRLFINFHKLFITNKSAQEHDL